MSPEALARLCEAARLITGETGTDLRALLDAYDTARAEGVAAERARVVAWLEKRAWMLPTALAGHELLSAVDRIKRGLHVKEGT